MCATAVSFLRLVFAPLQFTSHLVFLFIAATGCPDVDLEVLATAGCPVVGREMLETGFPNDWLDQTMSYQPIQTTSFAMHPRLVDYITVALVWMHCSCLLVILRIIPSAGCTATGYFLFNDVTSSLALLFTTADSFSFLLIDDITADVITNC
ncbi:hypothetical protein F511_14089 [Dorcoceras hygrometricum]|uniref:Uncharacterized protein n=1 Tax=Dorcoceras hygrometricum TaxID=472368 RepID=A0A2Z7BN26_9LAMI|nr:hypothetical protein F511_14089 [Dorcoceras hygrometricum]